MGSRRRNLSRRNVARCQRRSLSDTPCTYTPLLAVGDVSHPFNAARMCGKFIMGQRISVNEVPPIPATTRPLNKRTKLVLEQATTGKVDHEVVETDRQAVESRSPVEICWKRREQNE
jgi:hypothetical protein